MKLSNENHTELLDSPSLLQQSNNHQCEHCGKDFVSQTQLKAHIGKVHAYHGLVWVSLRAVANDSLPPSNLLFTGGVILERDHTCALMKIATRH